MYEAALYHFKSKPCSNIEYSLKVEPETVTVLRLNCALHGRYKIKSPNLIPRSSFELLLRKHLRIKKKKNQQAGGRNPGPV